MSHNRLFLVFGGRELPKIQTGDGACVQNQCFVVARIRRALRFEAPLQHVGKSSEIAS